MERVMFHVKHDPPEIRRGAMFHVKHDPQVYVLPYRYLVSFRQRTTLWPPPTW
jgi:hypothetical protein